jgi:hypothetical protein
MRYALTSSACGGERSSRRRSDEAVHRAMVRLRVNHGTRRRARGSARDAVTSQVTGACGGGARRPGGGRQQGSARDRMGKHGRFRRGGRARDQERRRRLRRLGEETLRGHDEIRGRNGKLQRHEHSLHGFDVGMRDRSPALFGRMATLRLPSGSNVVLRGTNLRA